MPRFCANLSFMFNEVPFADRFEAAAKAGFKGVEFLNPFEIPKDDLVARLKGNGLTPALFNMAHGDWTKGERGMSAIPGREAEFDKAVGSALEVAQATGCKRVFAMAGLKHQGATRAAYVANLKRAAKMAAGYGIDVIIEPINTRDIPGYFLNTTGEARSIIHEVAEPNLGLQFDLYHRQIMEGDVAMAIREFGPLARHYQIASPPDRGEPDDGEMNYAYLFKLIDETGFKGWVGCEYRPRKDTVEGLKWVKALGVSLG
jgi:2-dehydrotetronate isomerase